MYIPPALLPPSLHRELLELRDAQARPLVAEVAALDAARRAALGGQPRLQPTKRRLACKSRCTAADVCAPNICGLHRRYHACAAQPSLAPPHPSAQPLSHRASASDRRQRVRGDGWMASTLTFMAASLSGGPWMVPATAPSGVLRTCPTIPSSSAFCLVQARKKTPCTLPVTSKSAEARVPPLEAITAIAAIAAGRRGPAGEARAAARRPSSRVDHDRSGADCILHRRRASRAVEGAAAKKNVAPRGSLADSTKLRLDEMRQNDVRSVAPPLKASSARARTQSHINLVHRPP